MSTRAQLASALDRVAGRMARRQRRTPAEAPVELTRAYADLVLARAMARIGEPDRARQLADAAHDALLLHRDPVHTWVQAAFQVRIDQALARRPRDARSPPELMAQLDKLERVLRYKVDRLREAVTTLEFGFPADAIGAFRRKTGIWVRPTEDESTRASRAEQLVESAASTRDPQRALMLSSCLDALFDLPETSAMPILVRAIALVDSADVCAKAIGVAARFGWGELVPGPLGSLRARVADRDGSDLVRILPSVVRSLRRLGLHGELAELLAGVDAKVAQKPRDDLRRIAAAAWLFLDDPRGAPVLAESWAALDPEETITGRIELTRALARACALLQLGPALDAIDRLAVQVEDITDTFGTNTHFCVCVLHVVESLALAIEDLAEAELGFAGRT